MYFKSTFNIQLLLKKIESNRILTNIDRLKVE